MDTPFHPNFRKNDPAFMKVDTHLRLTEQQQQALEKISDDIAQSLSLFDALKKGFDTLLATMGRDGALVYLPDLSEHQQNEWLFFSPSVAWQTEIKASDSVLVRFAQKTFREGLPYQGVADISLGAVLPIRLIEKTYGALLISGPAIPPSQYDLWDTMLRPVARIIAHHSKIKSTIHDSPSYIEVLRSRNTLRAMFDSLPISIYIIDRDFQMVAINNIRASRTDLKPSQAVGRKCFEVLFNRSDVCPGCMVSETFISAKDSLRLRRNWLENNSFEEWEINTFPILDDNHRVIQSIIVEQDVTEKRSLEANLIQSEKLAAVGQLAAGIAHEINNPLTAIIANAQLLQREIDPGDEDLMDSVKLIEMAGTRASQVVRNLLGIARKENHNSELVDLNETIQNALTLVQHELAGRPIKIDLSLAKDLPYATGSQDQLQGVWINLILNAIDAVSEKESGIIAIQSRFTGSEFKVLITDNGEGIVQDLLPRVFEPFFTTKSPGRGTGLGLSVCLRSIRYLGGDIQVNSQVGEWTRFTVTLPGMP